MIEEENFDEELSQDENDEEGKASDLNSDDQNEDELEEIKQEIDPFSDFEDETQPEAEEDSPPDQQKAEIAMTPKPILPPSPQEERNWALWAHLSVIGNLFTGFLGGIAALIIYFVYKDRSRYVAYHAMQAFIFQTITWLGLGGIAALLVGLGFGLSFLLLPLLCTLPGFVFLLALPASLIYGIVGAVKVSNGEDFRYWLVGDWVRGILEPKVDPNI